MWCLTSSESLEVLPVDSVGRQRCEEATSIRIGSARVVSYIPVIGQRGVIHTGDRAGWCDTH